MGEIKNQLISKQEPINIKKINTKKKRKYKNHFRNAEISVVFTSDQSPAYFSFTRFGIM
jgi:hypothetical protein